MQRQGTVRRSLIDPRLQVQRASTVVLLGMSGAGKSTLANLLAFGEQFPEGGYEVGHGMDAQTTECEAKTNGSKECELSVMDTPGVPDTSRDKTLVRFDETVNKVRELPSLNAFVFLLKAGRTEDKDYEAFRILLKQYSKLPCAVIIACKVELSSGDPEGVRRARKQAAMELINRVIEKCALQSRRVYKYLLRHGDAGEEDVEMLRWYVCSMPGVSVAAGTLLTSTEMEERLSRLSDQETRIDELQDNEIPRLRELQNKLRGQICTLQVDLEVMEEAAKAPSRATHSFLTYIPWASWFASRPNFSTSEDKVPSVVKSKIAATKKAKEGAEDKLESVSRELDEKVAEVEANRVHPAELKRAQEELEELQRLKNR